MEEKDVIFKVNPQMSYYLPVIAFLVVAGVFFLLSSFWTKGSGFWAFIACFVAAGYQFIEVMFTTYTLTSNSFIIQKGFIGMMRQSIPLNKVQDVTINYNVIQRIFSCGDLIVDTAGAYKNIIVKNIPEPEKYSDKIMEQVHKK